MNDTGTRRGRRSAVRVERLQVTLDTRTLQLLDLIVETGRFGRNRNDALSAISTQYVQDNARDFFQKYLSNGEIIGERTSPD